MDGMTWPDYRRMNQTAESRGGVRVSFLDGQIELMFPSYEHEWRKSQLGTLVELWLAENDLDYFPHGSATLRKQLKRAGKEPDESYSFGVQKKIPDLVIEVAITGGGIDTLEIYRRFQIPEVWVWQGNKLHAFVLTKNAYQASSTSQLLPGLNLELLASCAAIPNGLLARKKFLAGLKK